MFEKTVNFDGKNSWTDYKIIFKTFTLGAPSPQLVLINVPFRNGSLDETDYFGDVKYNDRTLSMDFLIHWAEDYPYDIYSNVLNSLNGQRKKIKISADQGWYYEGRLTVGDLSIDSGFWNFNISALVDPYKYKDIEAKFHIDGSEEIELLNDYMPSIPIFNCNSNMVVTFEGKTYYFSDSTFIDYDESDPLVVKEVLFLIYPDIENRLIYVNPNISFSTNDDIIAYLKELKYQGWSSLTEENLNRIREKVNEKILWLKSGRGSNQNPLLKLRKGRNILEIQGNGWVTISYRQGRL